MFPRSVEFLPEQKVQEFRMLGFFHKFCYSFGCTSTTELSFTYQFPQVSILKEASVCNYFENSCLAIPVPTTDSVQNFSRP